MPRAANVRLKWTASVTPNVERRIFINRNGEELQFDLPPETTGYELIVPASSNVSFRTEVKSDTGVWMQSETYIFTTGTLQDAVPDTGLGHEILGVVDIPDGDPAIVGKGVHRPMTRKAVR